MEGMNREQRLQTELAEIEGALAEGSIDENGAEALRAGAMATYDQGSWTWWKLLGAFLGVVLALFVVLTVIAMVVP